MNAKKKSEASTELATPPIVLNNTNGPRYIPFGGVTADDPSGSVVDLERMKFASGLNMPKDPEEWAIVSALPSYKGWLAAGVFQELQSVAEVPTIGDADEKIIESSSSRPSMEWWFKHETRSKLRGKLKKKIAEMKRHRTPGDED